MYPPVLRNAVIFMFKQDTVNEPSLEGFLVWKQSRKNYRTSWPIGILGLSPPPLNLVQNYLFSIIQFTHNIGYIISMLRMLIPTYFVYHIFGLSTKFLQIVYQSKITHGIWFFCKWGIQLWQCMWHYLGDNVLFDGGQVSFYEGNISYDWWMSPSVCRWVLSRVVYHFVCLQNKCRLVQISCNLSKMHNQTSISSIDFRGNCA